MSGTAVQQDDRPVALPPVSQDLYRILLLRNDGSELLVAGERPPFTLPWVEIPRWDRVAENLSAAVRKRYQLSAICLFSPELPVTSTDAEPLLYQAMETRTANIAAPDETRWLPLNSIADQCFADEQDLIAGTAVLRQISEFKKGEAIGPFVRWNAIEEAAAELGLHVDPALTVQLEGDLPSTQLGYSITRKLLASHAPFTALFAFNDLSAIGACRRNRVAPNRASRHGLAAA